MNFVPILMPLFQADGFVSILVARSQWSCVRQRLSQPLGMAPLFLAGHQVFNLATSSLCAVGGNRKLTRCPAWDGVKLKNRELCCPSGIFCTIRPIRGSSHCDESEMAQLEMLGLALVSKITAVKGQKRRLWIAQPLAPLTIYFPNGP